MEDKQILKEALQASGMRQVDVAQVFGVNKATVSTNLRRDNMSVDTFVKYLNAMGFVVMVGKEESGKFEPMWKVENG